MEGDEERNVRGGQDGVGDEQHVLIHSQVRRIKREDEKMADGLQSEPMEMRPELTRQFSRSRLGPAGRPIAVGSK
ncbi:hypothetical protein MUK42_32834 [Musa troglodytarum]|uniref:Uncharacterized protein n=1 Tax=Musa troglodytarum TaxID=320322 RepID=A0A9E7IH61_9LILI|nr:hypothetical protein MUK42_32834 [Musa troglodytarum]